MWPSKLLKLGVLNSEVFFFKKDSSRIDISKYKHWHYKVDTGTKVNAYCISTLVRGQESLRNN